MSISIGCSGCGRQYTLDDKFAGKKLRCKHCGAITAIPDVVPLEDADPLAAMEQLAEPKAAGPAPTPSRAPVFERPATPVGAAELPPPRRMPAAAAVSYQMPPTARPKPVSNAPIEGATVALIFLYLVACVVALIKGITYPPPNTNSGILTTAMVTNVVLFFAMVAPLVLLGTFIGSKIMGFGMPDGGYVKAAGIAAVPGVILAFVSLLPSNPVLLIMAVVAIIPVAFYVLMYSFGLDLPKALVSFVFAGVFYVIGQAIAVMLVAAVVVGAIFGSETERRAEAFRKTLESAGAGAVAPRVGNNFTGAPADPFAGRINSLRNRVRMMEGQNFAQSTRERLVTDVAELQKEAEAIKSARPNDTELPAILASLEGLQKRAEAAPTEAPDAAVFADPLATGTWTAAEGMSATLDEELSFKTYKFRIPKDMLVDLRSSEADVTGVLWRKARKPGDSSMGVVQLSIASVPRQNARQKQPWVVQNSYQRARAQAERLFAVEAPGGEATTGRLADLVFTRIASKPSEDQGGPSWARQRSVKYVALDGNEWLVLTATSNEQDAQMLEVLEASVRTLRPAKGEAKADPFAAARIAPRLAESPEAAIALRRQGAAAEDALIALLKTDDIRTQQRAIELLAEMGTEKSVPALKELATSRNSMVANAAKEAWKKLSPKDADDVAQAMLMLESEDVFQRRKAMEMLAKAKPDDRREQIAPLLEKVLADGSRFGDFEAAGKALGVWGNSKTAGNLLPMLFSNENGDMWRRPAVIHVLGEMKDKRAVIPLLNMIFTREKDRALAALGRMGPVAEDDVLAFAQRDPRAKDPRVRFDCINVLGATGTAKSEKWLKLIAADRRDFELSNAAARAIDSIQSRAATTAPATRPAP